MIDLSEVLVRAVAEARAPGAAACVGDTNRVSFVGATGMRQLEPRSLPAREDTPYDLASLTKVVATTTAVMLLRDRGVLDLDQPVSDWLPVPAFRAFTVRHLLTHTAGLSPYEPWYPEVRGTAEFVQRVGRLPLETPPGTRRRYSDLGFILLGKIVELAGRDRLDAFCRRHIFDPLGMSATGFLPSGKLAEAAAATERCAWRGRVVQGVVHDEHAYAVGGVSGHAGLFSTAGDLARFCTALLRGELLAPRTLEEMTLPGQVPSYPWQGLGWKLDPWRDSVDGFLPARCAFGHTGWTGTCLWLDRVGGIYAVLLSNTCHPDRQARHNRTLRGVFFSAVAGKHYSESTNAHTGLDRLLRDEFRPLQGKRVALLANHAAVDALGRPILEVFDQGGGFTLARLFSPEHGFWGQAEAGAAVGGRQQGPVPVVSLYGEKKRPSRADLQGIDVFVVDLPDIGARYYTYMATMKECMAACAQAGVPMLVLDRPNPLGGAVLEGPIAQKTGSPVCCAEIPIRHGMSLGELAVHFWRTEFSRTKLSLQVSLADNWPRELMHDACALPWVAPSPNMPDFETALIYVGACLFEGANLNEGRGTDTPFLVIGAPWLDAEAVLRGVDAASREGCRLETARYTPRSIPGKAASPRYMDEACNGVRITVTDARKVRAFRLAVALLSVMRRVHPDRFAFTPFFDTLAGGPWLREQLEAGRPAAEIIEAIQPALEAFDKRRPRRYGTLMELYPPAG